jgi:hypothetical protein
MCIIVAKWFPGIGWAGAKNRDRQYIPELDFIESEKNGIDRMMMHDLVTGYKEGINSLGISILNTSLDCDTDEKEVESGETKSSPDGKLIASALLQNSVENAIKLLIKYKLSGCTIVFDQNKLYLIEASDQDGTKPYRYIIKKIPNTETVIRTNHGVWLPWAGFQRSSKDKQQVLDRISSESRMLQAEFVVEQAETPEDLVDGLCQVYINNPQLNIMRTSTEANKYRTTSQQLCVPKEKTLYCRPISSHVKFDFWRLNKPSTNVWVEILGNRELWQNVKGDPPFGHIKMKDL